MDSLSRPRHKRKDSAANGFASKSAYEDVRLSGGAGSGQKFGAHEYAEIFSGSSQRGSSIPVLDLPGLNERVGLGVSKVDYANIFGGFRDEDVAVQYEELVAAGGKRSTRAAAAASDKTRRSLVDAVSPLQESDRLNHSEKSKGPASADQSVDSTKQFNLSFNKTNQRINSGGSDGKMHIAELHAVPGFTYFVDGSQRAKKTEEGNAAVRALKREVSRTWSFSAEVQQKHAAAVPETCVSNSQTSNRSLKEKGGSSLDGPHPPSKLRYSGELNPTLNSSHPLNSNGHKGPRRTRSLSFSSKAAGSKKFDELSPTSSDEELDVNSVAAVSAAALKKAIEQAQESIRIAKEIMERKSKSCQDGSKTSSKGRSKPTEKKEKTIDRFSNMSKEKSANKIYEGSETIVSARARVDEEFTASLRQSKIVLDAREIEAENFQVVEHAERPDEARVLSELVTDAKQGTETLGSQSVENMVSSSHPANKLEEVENKTVVDWTDVIVGFTKESARPAEIESLEDVVLNPPRVQDLDKIAAEADNSLRTSHGQEKIEIKQNEFDKQETTVRKFEDHQEIFDREQFKLQMPEFDDLLNEFQIYENKKERQDGLGREKLDKKSQDVGQWEENGHTTQDGYDKEEVLSRQEEAHLWSENEEELEKTLEKEIHKREPKACQEAREVEEMLDGVHGFAINKDEDKLARYKHGLKIPGVHERESIQDVDAETSFQIEANKCAEGQKNPVAEAEETNRSLSESEKNHNSPEFQEVIHGKNFDAAVGTYHSDSSTTSVGTQEPCTPQMNKGSIEETEHDDKMYEETGNIQEIPETFNVQKGQEEREVVEDAFQHKDDEAATRASLLKENFVGSRPQDAFEALSSDRNRDSNHMEPQKHEDMLKTSGPERNVDQESAREGNTQDCPQFDPSDEKEEIFGISDIKAVLEQPPESDKQSESISSLEDVEGISVDDTQECAQAVEDVVENKEEKLEPSGSKYVEEQDVSMSWEPTDTEEAETRSEGGQDMQMNEDNLTGGCFNEEKVPPLENVQKVEKKDNRQRIEAINKEREREQGRLAVERAIREARERAFAEARERAERAAVERAAAEVRQRVMADAKEKLDKASTSRASADKATIEAKRRAERAAVERATAEARERALEKAMAQKTSTQTRPQADRCATEKLSSASRNNGLKHSLSSSDLERLDGNNNESAQRRKARLERHQRIMERAAKALAEKNMRDLLSQKEQAERNRLAESLDADIKRWATGKEGNLRALLSTLQYILGPDSGWQPISLTEIITTAAVKKAYRKATLYVHPDKLQQRGASIQQKYICEKIFDLLKAAWNRFNSEER